MRGTVARHRQPMPPRRPSCICGAAVVLLSVSLALPQPSVAQERIVRIANGAALPGQATQVAITLSSLADFAGGDFVLRYDPAAISILDVDRAASTDEFLLVDGAPGTGLLSVSMAAGEGLTETGPGAIVLVTIQSNPLASPGTLTPIVIREARWYDELSVRHGFIGDNGLFRVGSDSPEEASLTLSVSSSGTGPGENVTVFLSISIPEGIGKVAGDLSFDPAILENPALQPVGSASDWQSTVVPGNGEVHFEFAGTAEMEGTAPHDFVECIFTVSDSALPGARSDLSLSGLQAGNLEDFPYAIIGVAGEIEVTGNLDTPTPRPSPTAAEPTPTGSPSPFLPADFDRDGEVTETDLIRFLETWRQEATTP